MMGIHGMKWDNIGKREKRKSKIKKEKLKMYQGRKDNWLGCVKAEFSN